MSAWQATLDYAAGCGAEVDQVSDSAIVITAAGTHRLRIPVLLAVGPRYLRVQSFVGERIGRQLVAKEAPNDFLSENNRIQRHGGPRGLCQRTTQGSRVPISCSGAVPVA